MMSRTPAIYLVYNKEISIYCKIILDFVTLQSNRIYEIGRCHVSFFSWILHSMSQIAYLHSQRLLCVTCSRGLFLGISLDFTQYE